MYDMFFLMMSAALVSFFSFPHTRSNDDNQEVDIPGE